MTDRYSSQRRTHHRTRSRSPPRQGEKSRSHHRSQSRSRSSTRYRRHREEQVPHQRVSEATLGHRVAVVKFAHMVSAPSTVFVSSASASATASVPASVSTSTWNRPCTCDAKGQYFNTQIRASLKLAVAKLRALPDHMINH